MRPEDFYHLDRAGGRWLGAPPKCGSTAVKHWLLEQDGAGVPANTDVHAMFPDRRYTMRRLPADDRPAVLLVRHPLARLASAWQGRLGGRPGLAALLPGLLDDPHFRPQSWFRLGRARLVVLDRLDDLCPGIARHNARRQHTPLPAEVVPLALEVYADDLGLFREAMEAPAPCDSTASTS